MQVLSGRHPYSEMRILPAALRTRSAGQLYFVALHLLIDGLNRHWRALVAGHSAGLFLWRGDFIVSDQPETSRSKRVKFDIIEPVGKRVVIRKDENRRETKSGIVLPGNHEIPTLTGRVIAISKQIENDTDFPIRQYDKVLFDPREAIPVEFEPDNKLFVVPLDKVLAIFRKSLVPPAAEPGQDDPA